MRAMILYEHCSPHQVAVVSTAEKYFQERGDTLYPVEYFYGLREYTWTMKDKTRPETWHCLFPNRKQISNLQLFKAIWREVKRHKIDVLLINGWYGQVSWLLIFLKKLLGCRMVMVSDSIVGDFTRHWYKEWPKKWLMHCIDAGFVAGTPQKQYLHSLGVNVDRISMGNDAVDHSLYDAIPVRNAPVQRTIHIGTAGRMISVKNLTEAMRAFVEVVRKHPEYSLQWHLAGSGPLEEELKKQAHDLQAPVVFPGFVGYHEMPSFYSQLDLYWQPSLRESWGLVVNEAMASALPVLVSDQCGCAMDLVKPETGWVHDISFCGMVAGLENALHLKSQWPTLGNAARRLISQWDGQFFAKGLYQACQLALG